jgi:hypothetical protein
LNLESIQIQTLNLFLIFSFIPNLNSRLGPDSFSCSLRSAQLAPISAHQTARSFPASYHPPTAWAHTSVTHSPLSSPFLPSPRIRTAPGGSCRGRARAGWDGLPARPARTPRERRARAHPNRTRPRRDLPHLPPLRAPLQPGLSGRSRCHLGRPDGQSRGSLRLSPRRSRRQASKARRGRDPGAQATNPFGVFDSFIPCPRAERGGRRRGATPEERSTDREPGAGRGEGRRCGHLPH